MDIERLFEKAVSDGLFTDYDVCVKGPVSASFSGGSNISKGSRLFDVASLTKACTHLLFLKLFSERKISPEDSFNKFINVPQQSGDDRRLWHFMCYVVQSYGFDYESLRDGTTPDFKKELISSGFGHWSKRFKYDNIASAYLALLIEKIYGTSLEVILQTELVSRFGNINEFLFHPVYRKLVEPTLVVPTQSNLELRGLVHDPLSFSHQDSDLSVAGLFSTANTMASAFHGVLDEVIQSGFYSEVVRNHLARLGITDSYYGLGFDIPFQSSLKGLSVDGPAVFAGWTGCRVFFSSKPRVTVCFLTNRVLNGDSGESRQKFSQFSWSVIREVLRWS